MKSWSRSLRLVAALGAGLLALAACGSDSPSVASATRSTSTTALDAKPLDHVVKINFAYSPTVNAAPLFVAQAKGYFKAENLDVNMFPYAPSSATAEPLLATGRMDALYSSMSPGFLNGIYNGLDVRFVATGGLPRPGAPTSAFLAMKSGPTKTLKDLRGKKVSVNGGLGSLATYYLSELLKQADMTIHDIQIVDLPNDQGAAALQNGAIAAALTFQPQITQDIASGQKVALGDMDPVLAHGGGGGFIFGSNLVKDDRQAGAAVLRALQKASRTDLQGDWLKDAPIVRIVAGATGSTVETMSKLVSPNFPPDLKLGAPVFVAAQTLWRSVDVLAYPENLPVSKIFDQRLFDAATRSGGA